MITLPIYYTKIYKTKSPKTTLIRMNWYINAQHFEQNEVKKHYHELVSSSVLPEPVLGTYTLDIVVYYRNSVSDGSNVSSMFEKFILDSFQTLGITNQDNVKYHLGTTWSVGGEDKLNPRVEITLKGQP